MWVHGLPSIQPWRVVPPASAWIPRVPAYSGTAPSGSLALRLRGFHPLRPAFPDRSAALSRPPVTPAPPYNPAHVAACGLGSSPVWAPPRSLAATGGISFDFFSCGYLDGSLPRVSLPHTISFMCGCSPFQVSGLPHSETPASSDVCSYTGLFAACRVLPRLAAPRHPPWTLFSLDHIVLLVTLSLLNV